MVAGRVWEGAVCVILYLIAVVSCQAELRFGDRVVRNNSYVLRGDIPGDPGDVNALLCASDTTNPTTRQWYDRDGDALGTTKPTNGVYQAINITSGGLLLYTAGTIDTGLHYCMISDSSGNTQTLYVGLYTNSPFERSGRANGEKLFVIAHVNHQYAYNSSMHENNDSNSNNS